MPILEAHQQLAQHNQTVLERLLVTCDANPDWVIVVAFYKAVHLVEALFKHVDDSDSSDHYIRNSKLKREYPALWKLYAPLWMSSCVARYLESYDPRSGQPTVYPSFSRFRSANSVRNLVSENLCKLEEWIETQLPPWPPTATNP